MGSLGGGAVGAVCGAGARSRILKISVLGLCPLTQGILFSLKEPVEDEKDSQEVKEAALDPCIVLPRLSV